MKYFFNTLHGKISLIFVLLLFLLGIVQIAISVQSSLNFVCETDQTINRYLARTLAKKFQPHLKDSLNYTAIENKIVEIMEINPRIEIYLVDKDGNIKTHFSAPDEIHQKKINTKPIVDFIQDSPEIQLPIMGDDPKSDNGKRVFSAAEIDLGPSEKGYLYVILGSELFDTAMSGMGGSYILSTTAFVLGVTLLFAGALGSVLFFNLTKRLRQMTQTVLEFEGGDYHKRIIVKSDDEVGQLTLAFNHMADSLEASMLELKKNDSLRRELIANISHDLRSPLASIQGYIETILMKESNIDPVQRREFLETILTNVTNLNLLVSELFELSKLDAMQTKPDPELFSIAELSQDVVLKFQPQAERKSITLITKMPRDLPFVIGDIGMMDRVLSNLIDNAIRYTPQGGKIVIVLENQDEDVVISIIDNGEGIPEEDQPHVFERFYRVEKSRTKNSGGSGLGLAIVKKIIQAHKSEIIVSSKINEGTTFTFKLKKQFPSTVTAT